MSGTKSEIRLKIKGMHCGGCVQMIGDALRDVAGVDSANVDLKAGIAVVSTNGGADPAPLIRAIKDVGYSAKVV